MKICKVAIGNENEAFVEERFNEGINLIYGNDNNKGKTIVMQSIGYALGNEPIFPKGFDYKNYYYYLKFSYNDIIYEICRKSNEFLVITKDHYYSLVTESEFKKWFNRNVFDLPKIIKDNKVIIVDFVLFLQSFFLGQDKRDSSSVKSTYFKTKDFISMLHYMCGVSNVTINEEYSLLKEEIDVIKKKLSDIRKKTKIIKKLSTEAKAISNYANKQEFIRIQQLIDAYNDEISTLNNRRAKIYNRISKNNTLKKEIIELNKIDLSGELYCKKCNEKIIVYKTSNDIVFDVSTSHMRNEILKNLETRNSEYLNEVSEIEEKINTLQSQIQELLNKEEMKSVNLILFRDDLIKDLEYDKQLLNLSNDLEQKQRVFADYVKEMEKNTKEQKKCEEELKAEMSKYYQKFENSNTSEIDEIFTKASETYSGSENTIFFVSRLLAILKVSKHFYPLLIDGFREGEVSTSIEKEMMDTFKNIDNQIILTATLKEEEYHKYDLDELINKIDYSNITSKKLLQVEYVDKLRTILSSFAIKL